MVFINEVKGYEEFWKLLDEWKVKYYKWWDFIFEEGDYLCYFYFVKLGKVKVFKINEDGKEYIIEICKEGDFFGYLDLLKEEKYIELVVVMEEIEISLIFKEDFLKLLNVNWDVVF